MRYGSFPHKMGSLILGVRIIRILLFILRVLSIQGSLKGSIQGSLKGSIQGS